MIVADTISIVAMNSYLIFHNQITFKIQHIKFHKFYTYLFFLINKPHHAIRYNLINDNLKIRAFFDLLQVQLAYIFDLVRGGSSSSLSCTTLFSFKFFMSVLNKNHNHFKLDHINILLLVLLSLFFVTKQLDVGYKMTKLIK